MAVHKLHIMIQGNTAAGALLLTGHNLKKPNKLIMLLVSPNSYSKLTIDFATSTNTPLGISSWPFPESAEPTELTPGLREQ